jgi:hypothetical protein
VSPEKLQQALSYLTRPVPPARRPVAKPQASWQQLKVGQRLNSRGDIIIGTQRFTQGSFWEVAKVDSSGAELVHEYPMGGWVTYKLTNPDWKSLFERVRAPSRRKSKSQVSVS